MLSELPLNAADSIAVPLFVIAAIFLHFGLTNERAGYTTLGIVEVALGLLQMYINRR